MRNVVITLGEYYHIYNRGNHKQPLFLEEKDWARFLFLIIYLQSPKTFFNISHYTANFVKHSVFNISKKTKNEIIMTRYVELVSFTLMPNHFHLILKETKEEGISKYMQRILNAYTKYFNTKYEKSGHLFQGPYQAVHIKSNEQLLYLSSYVHRNQRELATWKEKEHRFPWSSYRDYIGKNRWGGLLKNEIVSDQFSNKKEYRHFVETSGAKEFLDEELLIDLQC